MPHTELSTFPKQVQTEPAMSTLPFGDRRSKNNDPETLKLALAAVDPTSEAGTR
jgi:hypothetical protein